MTDLTRLSASDSPVFSQNELSSVLPDSHGPGEGRTLGLEGQSKRVGGKDKAAIGVYK